MHNKDIFSLALKNLQRRRSRTILTIIGVIIGTTAIVSMFGLSIGLSNSIDTTISNLGDLTILEIYNNGVYVDSDGNYHLTNNSLSDDLVSAIQYIDGVLAVCPQLQSEKCSFIIYAGDLFQIPYATVVGIDPRVLPFFDFHVQSGYLPTAEDHSFILFGSETLYQFIDPNKVNKEDKSRSNNGFDDNGNRIDPPVDVFSEPIIVQSFLGASSQDSVTKRYRIDTVGVLKSSSVDNSNAYTIFMDISTVRAMILEQEKLNHTKSSESEAYSYSSLLVKTKDVVAAEFVENALDEMGLNTYGLSDYRKEMQSSKASIETILAAIGFMSLLVSAIGISNTTIMSVYERTSEIGIMKVLGCSNSAIYKLFVCESSVLGFIGGVLGSMLSLVISFIMNQIPNLTIISGIDKGLKLSVIPFYLIIIAIGAATLVGLVAGYFPAQRAMRISVMAAIKNQE